MTNNFKKKYKTQKDLLVYPSTLPTIEVDDTCDNMGGVYRYRVRLCGGFKGSFVYENKKEVIAFVRGDDQKCSGLQPEQLALILLDRAKKMKDAHPYLSESYQRQIDGLKDYLEACEDIMDDLLNGRVKK